MVAAAVIEVLGRDGQVRAVHKVQAWPCTLGRSPACDIVLDDAHLAGVHARLSLDAEQQTRLEMLPSLNGGRLGEQTLAAGSETLLPAGPVQLQLGALQLRLRRASDALAPELPLTPASRLQPQSRWALPALLLLWLGLLWFDQWSALNPGSQLIDYAAPVLAPLAVLLGWAGLWALLTQLFQHRFPFVAHLWRALVGVSGLHLLGFVLPLLAYMFSQPRLMVLDALAFPAGLAALLWWHAALVWPRGRRALAWVMGGLLLSGLLLVVAKRQQQQHWFGPPYVSALPPPAWRLAAPKPPEALIEALRPLEAELAERAKRDDDEAAAEDEAAE